MLLLRNRLGITKQGLHLVQRLRFQLPVGLLLCVALPAFIRAGGSLRGFQSVSIQGAVLGGATAFLLALYLFRRLGDFPGVQAGSHIILSTTASFAIVAILFVLLRPDYTRFVLVGSYGATVLWFTFLHLAARPIMRPSITVVPGGHADDLPRLEGANWQMLCSIPETRRGIEAVAADLRHDHSNAWERFLALCTLEGIPVYHSKQITESLSGKVEIEHLSENEIGSLLPNLTYFKVKQLMDWFIALLILPLFLLLFVVVAPIIVAGSGWPVLYTQERIGYRGRRFLIYKFRTMTQGGGVPSGERQTGRADAEAGEVPAGQADHADRERAMTRDGDSRITPFGRFLRRYRIDETPQILNILKGEMSWIGPRPEAVTLSKWYDEELGFYPYRHVVRPGITGWAQVNQGHVTSPQEVLGKLHYDFFYIKYLSLWLDLLIVIKTFHVLVRGFGAR